MRIELTEKEALFLIMCWNTERRRHRKEFHKHYGVATMVRLKLQNVLDYGRMEEIKK